MSFWTIDLTTEDGSANAAAAGGTASFVAAGLTLLGAIFAIGMGRIGGHPFDVLGIAAVSIIVYLSAGIRLREGKGVFWGGTAVAFLVLEAIMKLIALTVFGLLITTSC